MDIKVMNRANIDNLTSLWKKMGAAPYIRDGSICMHASTSWPHRFWFDWDVDVGQVAMIDRLLARLPARSIVPVWAEDHPGFDHLECSLDKNRFKVLLEQTAMYLALENYTQPKKSSAGIENVTSEVDIAVWTQTASEAFGYAIDVSVVRTISSDPDIQLLLYFHEGKAAGTALLYTTAPVTGVHQVGVTPPFRRQGIASSLMQHVLERCRARGSQYVTLQASAPGKGLYRRLDFIEQFMVASYQRR